MLLAASTLAAAVVAATRIAGAVAPSPRSIPTIGPEPPAPFGRVIYRASNAGSFEQLGVAVIACRHRDDVPRDFLVQFFDSYEGGKQVSVFGRSHVEDVPPGKKIVFVSEASHYKKRADVADVRLGHLSKGTARVVSDARRVHCRAKMHFDPGARAQSYWRGMGLVRQGVGATPAPNDW